MDAWGKDIRLTGARNERKYVLSESLCILIQTIYKCHIF